MTTFYKATRPDGRDFHTGTIDYGAALASGEVIRHPTSERMVLNDASTYISVSVEPADCTGFRWPCRLFRVEPEGKVLGGMNVSRHKRGVLGLRVPEELPAWQVFGPNGEAVVSVIERARTLTRDEASRMVAARDAARDAALVAARDAALVAARVAAWDAARVAALVAAWDAARDAALVAARDAALVAAMDAARDAALVAALVAAWDAAMDAARDAARDAAWDAAWGAALVAAWDAARDAARALLVRDRINPEHFETLVAPWVAGVGRTWEGGAA